MVLRGLASELERNPAIRLVGQATDSTELIALLDRNSCDVLVLDYAMPGGSHGDGLVLISHLRRRWLDLRVVLYTMVDNPALLLAIVKHGVKAVVSKSDSMSRLVDGVYAAHGGRRYYSPLIKDMLLETMMVAETDRLTPREAEIVRLFCAGGTITEIAERLHRSVQTVSTQKRSAMRKLGVSRDVDLIKLFSDIPQKTQAAQAEHGPALPFRLPRRSQPLPLIVPVVLLLALLAPRAHLDPASTPALFLFFIKEP